MNLTNYYLDPDDYPQSPYPRKVSRIRLLGQWVINYLDDPPIVFGLLAMFAIITLCACF